MVSPGLVAKPETGNLEAVGLIAVKYNKAITGSEEYWFLVVGWSHYCVEIKRITRKPVCE